MRNYFLGFLVSCTSTILVIGVLNFVVDPLQYFRAYTLGTPIFFDDQRYQVPGLARNYRYDTVIIGTSMTENFDPKYIQKKTGWLALKLSINGSTAYEQRKILEVALNTGQVQRVLWGVQWDAFARPAKTRTDLGGMPEYFYEDDIPSLIKGYLLNISTLGRTIAVAFGKGEKDLNRLNNWHAQSKFGCESIQKYLDDKLAQKRFNLSVSNKDVDISKNKIGASLQENLFAVIQNNPQVDFYIFTPPYSLWFFRWLSSTNRSALESYFSFREDLASGLKIYKNVKFFDYQAIQDIITNQSIYKDLTHYSQDINQKIIDGFIEEDGIPLASRGQFDSLLSSSDFKHACS